MESGHAFAGDTSQAHHRDHDLNGRSAPGLVDEVGDRLLILDDRDIPQFELLRFRQALTASPGFEVALRRRVERLRHFRHPAFARPPTVEYLGQDRSLALLSEYTPGLRLSDLLAHTHDAMLAASLIHQLTPALDTLNDYGEGVGHGALTASRIVSAPDGSLIIVEHVLGPAVERLHLTAAALHRDLGIPVCGADTEYARIDGPTDCFQLALIALSMLLGRPLVSDEYSDLAGALNAALPAADRAGNDPVAGLRVWLERALQLRRGFLTSGEAKAALRQVDVPDPAESARRWRILRETLEEPVASRSVLNDALWDAPPVEHTASILPMAEAPPRPVDVPPGEPALAAQHEPVAPSVAVPSLPETDAHRHSHSDGRRSTFFQATHGYLRWAFVAVALCAILEAFVIARMLSGRGSASPSPAVAQINLVTNEPGAPVKVDGRLAGVTPLDLSINAEMRSITVGSALTVAPKQERVVGSTGQDTSPRQIRDERIATDPRSGIVSSANQRSGGIRVSSPIELEVFEGDRRLGSTATGIVSAPAGRHELDLINSVLGFRSRQVVEVRGGQVVGLTVTPPDGRINVNAVPWAEVLIDGKSVGETPIGNLSVPVGEHEIVFRHPQLGEVRQKAVVRSDAVTRVSANLER